MGRHIVESMDRRAWSRDGEGGGLPLIKGRKGSLTAVTCPRIWPVFIHPSCFISSLTFYNSVKLLSSVLIGWGPERWRNRVFMERGGHVMYRVKPLHHLKLSIKSTIQTNVLCA